ncbi:MAG: AAA family ATPase, partial [Tepidisphaeraceae bacterium]
MRPRSGTRPTRQDDGNALVLELPSPVPVIRSERAAEVARYFELEAVLPEGATPASGRGLLELLGSMELPDLLLPRPGRLVLLTGPSGSGKSTLLRAIRDAGSSHAPRRWIDLARLRLPDRPLVDCFGTRVSLERVLKELSRVGLAEAWSYLRTPGELSEGQRWRLRLAMGMWRAGRARETAR